MSNKATKARNKEIKSKKSFKTGVRRFFWWMVLIYLVWLLIQSLCGGTKTVTIINTAVLTAEAGMQNEQEGVKIEQHDPCGLKVVQCDGEDELEAPVVKFEGKQEIVAKIRKAFPEEAEIMVAVAMGESGLNPSTPPNGNTNGTTDTGIFRINSVHGYTQEHLENIDNNIAAAKKIFEERKEKDGIGFTAWVAYTNGSYKKFL